MLFQIKAGAVEFGAERVLKRVNFEIRDKEKIAIVGRNGCGKTTLLRLITGEVELIRLSEETELTRAGKLNIGYLRQNAFSDLSRTVDAEMKTVFAALLKKGERMEELLLKMQGGCEDTRIISEYNRLNEEFTREGGYYYEKEYNLLLQKFGFLPEDKARPLGEFSGGQLTKLAFIKLLLEKPDVLLLDEPTNHLDINTVEWLEEYLKEYKGAIVFVSHDRMFIDKIADTVYEIEHGITKRYVGNYTSFVKQKEESYERELKEYNKQQAEIKRLEALIERFRDTPTKVSMTDSKLKQIEHMEKLEKPQCFDTRSFKASIVPKRDTGKEVLKINNLTVGYDKPLATVNMLQYKGQRIGIIGGNGLGKSTLLKTIVGIIPKISGDFTLGYQVDVGHFDQQLMQYKGESSVLDELWNEFPKLSETEARTLLGTFLFTGDDVFKKVSELSGGERVRLALCKLLKSGPNFLVLDEPTNHMDMIGKETLESMLSDFSGTILFVSHDRYFVSKLADSLLVFENGTATFLPYTYHEYLEKRDINPPKREEAKEKAPQTQGRQDYARSKERAKWERRLSKIEELIAELDSQIEDKRNEQSLPENTSNYQRLCELSEEIDVLEERMLGLMEESEELSRLLKN